MIDKVQISNENLRDLHEKGAQLNPHQFELEHLAHSGRHIHDVISE
jgi:hypothetical protein